MIVETHDSFQRPLRVNATRVVIYDDLGNPIGAFIQHRPGHVTAEIADNNVKFQRLLRQMGVQQTVIVDTIKAPMPLQRG